jgi:hypothetical protein
MISDVIRLTVTGHYYDPFENRNPSSSEKKRIKDTAHLLKLNVYGGKGALAGWPSIINSMAIFSLLDSIIYRFY